MDKKLEHRFYRLFALKISGDATPEELRQLEEIVTDYPTLRFFYDELIKPVSNSEAGVARAEQFYAGHAANMHLQGLWEDEQKAPQPAKKNGLRKKLIRYVAAASIVLAASMGSMMLWNRKPEAVTGNETATTKGSKSTVKLPDGTVVMLNANSRLSYSEKFTGTTREVSLAGEAYFDVAHDAAHPFIIHTNAGDIKVLGTAFNVKTFENGFFETALIRGKVAIQLKDHEGENIVLSPGQKLVVGNNYTPAATKTIHAIAERIRIEPIAITKDSLVAETSWTQGQLVYFNKPLVEIAEDLERTFGVTIEFKSDKAKEYRYSGVFDDTDLDQILEILQLSKPISYHRNKTKIEIE